MDGLFNNYEMHNDCQRFLKYLKKGEFPKVKWSAEAVVETIDIDFPTQKEEILSNCGRWWVWINPNKRIRVKESLKNIEEKKFSNEKELYHAIKSNFD